MEAIRLLDRPDLTVDIVIGQTNPHRATIEAACHALPGVTFHCQVGNMASLMADADLFIGAGGTSSWERCCIGLPALVIATADNQIAQATAWPEPVPNFTSDRRSRSRGSAWRVRSRPCSDYLVYSRIWPNRDRAWQTGAALTVLQTCSWPIGSG